MTPAATASRWALHGLLPLIATTCCSWHPTMHMQSDWPSQMHMQTSGGIEYMKMDMCGGAAVLGAAESISLIRPEGVEASPLSTLNL